MQPQLPQLIPSEICLECPVCCRFPEKQAALSPFFFPEERSQAEFIQSRGSFRQAAKGQASKAQLVECGHGFACSFFNPEDHTCQVYEARPLDCSMYPAVIMHSEDHRKVMVGADTKCPALERPHVAARLKHYLDSIQRYLESTTLSSLIRKYPQFISEFQEEVVEVRELSLGKV
ncbi:MAG TPA: YkgJ family cysteine cluster protein [bacterium]|nr:YkgJ family cysteine cluster protein [bacterium]